MKLLVTDRELYAKELADGFHTGYVGDAGIDLRLAEDVELRHGQVKAVPLGVQFELEANTVGWLTGRSSTHTRHRVAVHEGKIDSGYRGPVHAVLSTVGDRIVHLSRGMRLVQVVVVQLYPPTHWHVAEQLDDSERGSRGFGSSGE